MGLQVIYRFKPDGFPIHVGQQMDVLTFEPVRERFGITALAPVDVDSGNALLEARVER